MHFSRYFPHYKMETSSITPIETLEKAWEIAKEKVKVCILGEYSGIINKILEGYIMALLKGRTGSFFRSKY